jgi:hypothetical protein
MGPACSDAAEQRRTQRMNEPGAGALTRYQPRPALTTVSDKFRQLAASLACPFLAGLCRRLGPRWRRRSTTRSLGCQTSAVCYPICRRKACSGFSSRTTWMPVPGRANASLAEPGQIGIACNCPWRKCPQPASAARNLIPHPSGVVDLAARWLLRLRCWPTRLDMSRWDVSRFDQNSNSDINPLGRIACLRSNCTNLQSRQLIRQFKNTAGGVTVDIRDESFRR